MPNTAEEMKIVQSPENNTYTSHKARFPTTLISWDPCSSGDSYMKYSCLGSAVPRQWYMPEFRKDTTPPLSQDFFESLDHVDESALARLIVEMQLNRPYELPDLRSIFFQRKRQQVYAGIAAQSSVHYNYPAMRPQPQRSMPRGGRPWPMYV
ncbi:predicted protein [Nematostella vectensis]|uniref:Uncharacterized protein n=1 Tax=Nematostella vectensis TaxID=45351 RepID=A7SBU7_NEMVE|nr:predicted protein [Nematostella vectensis]|eukprot:XP_001630919.1 predicted protein [Nematostella vectensis]